MAPVRLRHPKGATTIQVDFDNFTVLDLQQEIYAATEIPPSLQDCNLGIKGEPLIVNSKLGAESRTPEPSAPAPTSIAPPASQLPMPEFNGGAASSGSNSSPESVEISPGQFLVHRIVPDDNSCLFSSVALVFLQDQNKAQSVRKIVADAIKEDMVTWNEAILGYAPLSRYLLPTNQVSPRRPRDEYISTIQKPLSWGGAIELTILAKHFSTEIASIDVETGRIDEFPPDPDADSGYLCILIYSGIHYDAATIAPMQDAPADFHQTLVGQDDKETVLKAAKKLADSLRAKKAYTNTATFDLKCQVCGKGLKGEKEARSHASETGHTEFGEY
ncbi:ubiquitin-specific protease otu1 [Steccherinum ochraceum]|uniref:Ubiquitin thioesterase OTU n=1 Tax=Steccherinum ochraceum TaxID=92696 RepID=A0A4R0RH69_9APHY|nr:ubiquitin-specific protease otu1 [Steccherinum ochraceum]